MHRKWRQLLTSICASALGVGGLGCELAAQVDRSQIDANDDDIVCGDGQVEGTEVCDDGNVTASDGCSDKCAIETGYGCTGTPSVCSDIDECSAATSNCSENATCTNSPGSFSCACNAGYTGDGVTCDDIDECTGAMADCGVNATCTNSPGSFTCACAAGYDGDGKTCTNVDECTTGVANCDANAACTDSDGSFACVCNVGYSGDGMTCANDDECTLGTAICGMNASCIDSPGSYDCMCNMGYMGDGQTCTNVNECMLGTDNCDMNATCTDTNGSFACVCAAGYSGDGVTCANDNECMLGTATCGMNASCVDTPGSYDCVCNMGYSGDGTTCTNVDECTLGTDNCDMNAMCSDTNGSFVCVCNSGYSGDGVMCTNDNECMLGTDNCNANATCSDTAGSFTCACNAGYAGDGVTCTPTSCKAIKTGNPAAASGPYQIDPDGNGSTPVMTVYCDMTTSGGGWTLVLNDGTTFNPALLGADAATGFNSSYVHLAYSTVAITADVMLDASDTAIVGTNQQLRTVIAGVPPAVVGKTVRELFTSGGPYYLDAENNSNVTNTFAGGLVCGTFTDWADYKGAACGTAVFAIRDAAGPSCANVGTTFPVGIEQSYTVAIENCAGWHQAPNFNSINFAPDNLRIWVR